VLRDVTARVRAQEAMLRVHDALELGVQERAGELRHANEALEESLRARDDFLAIASHELRTPLTPLLLQLEGMKRRLERGVLNDGILRDSLTAAIRNVARMTALVDRLLDRTDAPGGGPLARETVDLCALAREVAARFERDLARQRCTLSLRCEGSVTGSWDPDLIDQILVSLLSNAVKYGAGKPIEIEIAANAETARVTVRDHGIGIARENQARIFDRFVRAVPTTHYGGFGLGLWVARRAVLAHGGHLDVTSALDEGATFIVELPRSDAQARRSA